MKKELCFVLCAFLFLNTVACTVMSPDTLQEYRYRVELFAEQEHRLEAQLKDSRLIEKYIVRPFDVFDVIFHFDNAINTEYKLEVGDEIEVNFLAATELNAIHKVRPDGVISLPYIGEIKARGYTTLQLSKNISDLYVGVLKDRAMFIVIKSFQNQLNNIKESLRHPQTGFSRLIKVRSDARLTLPLIGEIDVNNVDLDTLSKTVNEKYKLQHPAIQVDMLLKSASDSKIFVLGEVNKPGAYSVNQPLTILEALSLAGGTNQQADVRTVIAVRREGVHVVAKAFDVQNVLEGTGNLVILKPQDTIYVSRKQLSKAAEVARQIASIVLFNGWGTNFSLNYRIDDKENP